MAKHSNMTIKLHIITKSVHIPLSKIKAVTSGTQLSKPTDCISYICL